MSPGARGRFEWTLVRARGVRKVTRENILSDTTFRLPLDNCTSGRTYWRAVERGNVIRAWQL